MSDPVISDEYERGWLDGRRYGPFGVGFEGGAVSIPTAVDWVALRAPFPPEQIGKLPKGKERDPKSDCGICGGFHGQGMFHLDYIGHAWINERLNEYGGDWVLEVGDFMFSDDDLVWVRGTLIIGGVKRHEVGCADPRKTEWPKMLYSDTLTRCAMRFGIGLALWQKDTPVGEDRVRTRGAQAPSGGAPRSSPVTTTPADATVMLEQLRGHVAELDEASKAAWEAWKLEWNWEANRQASTLGSSGLLDEAIKMVTGLLAASGAEPY